MIDLYCERIGPAFWAEPINALTNLSFIAASIATWMLASRKGLLNAEAWSLITIMMAIGIGSFLFHTKADKLTRVLDIAPILLFQLVYLWIYLRRIIGVRRIYTVVCLATFLLIAIYSRGFPHFLNGSLIYLPSLVLLFSLSIYHFYNARKSCYTLLLASGVFLMALLFRTVDLAICDQFPIGTHFVWHLLNGIMVYLVTRGLIMNLHSDSSIVVRDKSYESR